MAQPKSFTLKNESGLINQLVTPCHVSAPFNPLHKQPPPTLHGFKALWDTGASGSVISQEVINKLGIKPVGKKRVFHVDGESVVDQYIVNIFLPNGVAFAFVNVTHAKLSGFDLLIGMDIIATGDFAVTNFGGKTCFSFRHPSSEVIDFVKPKAESSEVRPLETPHIGRNDRCFCNSGKKYKHCHGKDY